MQKSPVQESPVTEAVATEPNPTGTEPPAPTRSWTSVTLSLAGQTAAMPDYDRGSLAGLRRMNPELMDEPACRRLIAQAGLLDLHPQAAVKWALILHGIALMTRSYEPTTPQRSAHQRNVSVGRALCQGNDPHRQQPFYSPTRLQRLMRARGKQQRQLLRQLFRRLAVAGVSFDWVEMAHFILYQDFDRDRADNARRRIFDEYYRAHRHQTEPPRSAEPD